jgi:hypothetical protein
MLFRPEEKKPKSYLLAKMTYWPRALTDCPEKVSGNDLLSTRLFPTSMSYPAKHLLSGFILLAL